MTTINYILFFLLMLVTSLYADIILPNKIQNNEECVTFDDNRQCVKCGNGQQIKDGKCITLTQSHNDKTIKQIDKCQNRVCSDAVHFTSIQQFTNFVGKYYPYIQSQLQPQYKNKIDLPSLYHRRTATASSSGSSSNIASQGRNIASSTTGQTQTQTQNSITQAQKATTSGGTRILTTQTQPSKNASPSKYRGYLDVTLQQLYQESNTLYFKIIDTMKYSNTINIDKANLIVNDNTYIYIADRQTLSIIVAYPTTNPKVISTTIIHGDDVTPQAIFIQDNILGIIGIGQVFSYNSSHSIDADYMLSVKINRLPIQTYTFIKIYSVLNRHQPILLKQFQVSGSYLNNSRLTNGFWQLVTKQSFNYMRTIPWYYGGKQRKNITVDNIYWYPSDEDVAPFSPLGINIFIFNLQILVQSNLKMVTFCVQEPDILYLSKKSIYIATNTYSPKIQYTRIKKIDFSIRQIRPVAETIVLGTVSGQTLVHESDGFLSIVTSTISNSIQSNNIYVLNNYLRPHGFLSDIAPKEKIKFCHYVDTRVYFKTVDNTYVVSIANMKKPILVGKLEISGLLSYIQPYDANIIMAITKQPKDNTEKNNYTKQEFKISILNASNISNIQQIDYFKLQDSKTQSIVEAKHKNFIFIQSKNLIVISSNINDQNDRHNSAFTFDLTSNKSQLNKVLIKSDKIPKFIYSYSECRLNITHIQNVMQTKELSIDYCYYSNLRNHGGTGFYIQLPSKIRQQKKQNKLIGNFTSKT